MDANLLQSHDANTIGRLEWKVNSFIAIVTPVPHSSIFFRLSVPHLYILSPVCPTPASAGGTHRVAVAPGGMAQSELLPPLFGLAVASVLGAHNDAVVLHEAAASC